MPPLPILAAAALAVPAPDFEDLGLKLLQGVQLPGTIQVDLFVGPDGTILDCQVLYTERSKSGGARYCRNAPRQKVAQPAVGPDGSAAYGVLRFGRISRVEYSSGDASPPDNIRLAPDLELEVQSLPPPFKKRMRVTSVALVDANGKLAQCRPDGHALADYAKVACDQLKQVPLPVRRAKDGQPVPYVKELDVDFVTSG
jgi:hypothetical protein